MIVADGITDKTIIRTHLDVFVRNELFSDAVKLPSKSSRCYYPSDRDINNSITKAKLRLKYSAKDQDDLERRIALWEVQDPEAKFFLRKFSRADNPDQSLDSFLFVSQEGWQRELLVKYGQSIFLLDATYKCTQYSLPLFFICVKTNVDYVVVGQFICQYEDAKSIGEALKIILSWNPDWKNRG